MWNKALTSASIRTLASSRLLRGRYTLETHGRTSQPRSPVFWLLSNGNNTWNIFLRHRVAICKSGHFWEIPKKRVVKGSRNEAYVYCVGILVFAILLMAVLGQFSA